MNRRTFLLTLPAFTVGCSLTGGGGGGNPKMTVAGDMSLEEAKGWIEQGAACIGMKPQTWGHFVTVQRSGPFDYTWTNPDGTTGTHKRIGGVAHIQPDGSFWMHYMNHSGVKLHEFGWHVNKIKKYRDYSEPPTPYGWCNLTQGLVAAQEEPLEFPTIVIGPDGTVYQ